ncbi:hypothetical protein J3U68_09990 [Snodgrassella sp. B3882]|uniref:hypothetical protein n=1 Tax=Snodgrassella sp. B3882 TaxID=2818037 RepID=UPI00226982CA|nr:hypothetical protein [Snodgrassella sp. B3882]MCX8745737.1 hypothetical protein [Snodgrassella sp. B3882]
MREVTGFPIKVIVTLHSLFNNLEDDFNALNEEVHYPDFFAVVRKHGVYTVSIVLSYSGREILHMVSKIPLMVLDKARSIVD